MRAKIQKNRPGEFPSIYRPTGFEIFRVDSGDHRPSPVLTYLEPLDRAALRNILTEPKNAIIRQYIKLFELDGITLKFDEDVYEYIVDKAIEFRLGARGLRSICEAIMTDLMFEVPSQGKKNITITKAYAEEKMNRVNAQKLRA